MGVVVHLRPTRPQLAADELKAFLVLLSCHFGNGFQRAAVYNVPDGTDTKPFVAVCKERVEGNIFVEFSAVLLREHHIDTLTVGEVIYTLGWDEVDFAEFVGSMPGGKMSGLEASLRLDRIGSNLFMDE